MITSNFAGVYLEKAMEAFTAILIPITALSYVATNEQLNPGDTVKIPFAQNQATSSNFDYSNGYNTTSSFMDVRDVQLSSLVYQKFALNDSDIARLNDDAIGKLAHQCGEAIARDVIGTALANTVTNANFPLSASCLYSNLTSSVAISGLVLQADNANWPVSDRNLILNPTAFNSLIQNTGLNTAFSYGGAQVIQDGTPTKVMGFNVHKTTATMPNSCNGLVLNPNSILTCFGTHKVTSDEARRIVNYSVATDRNGLSLSIRSWYDPLIATTMYTVDCLFGNAVGQSGALFQMK